MEERKQPAWDKPCYYDKDGVEIEEGDLLEVFHFIHYRHRRKCYMYHVAVWQEYKGLWMWGGRDYNAEKAHYNLSAVANKETSILPGYRIIAKPKWETADQKRKEGRKRILTTLIRK